MPHFFFRLQRSGKEAEIDDIELPDCHAARREALQACSDLLREMDGVEAMPEDCEMEVTGEDGARIVLVHLTTQDFIKG